MPTRPTIHASPAATDRRRGIGALMVLALAGLLAAGGCAQSRDARYEQILRGEILAAGADEARPDRFTAAFPENAMLELVLVDGGG